MDPNVTLAEMRELAGLASEGTDVRRNERELRWKWQELDEWLSKGGMPPRDWRVME